jgi:putative ABC transport system ATP-binding protein
MAAQIELQGIERVFHLGDSVVHALAGIDLRIEPGEYISVMGPSGSGKSTLLQVVAGLDTPDEGEVVLQGRRLTGLSQDELARVRRRGVGLVFQFFNLLEGMSALENVVLAALAGGATRRGAEQRSRELLDVLGLLGKERTSPSALSGGQRQRLAIARALANAPALLLADEPTGALDSDGAAEVLDLFARLNADGQTILIVTHNPDVASAAGRVVRMRDGQVLV